jgi:2'-5' RNA ligase
MSRQPILTDAETVRDHWWWRPGWRVGRRFYTWHITFTGQQELQRLAQEYQAALARLPQVDPVPPEWLHLTVQGVGFLGDVSDNDIRRIVGAVRRRLGDLPPAALTFHRPVVLPEAAALPPEPPEPIHAIRGAIRAAIGEVWGEDAVPESEDGYRAHVSVGYINTAGPAAPVIEALRDTRPAPASAIVRAASLIVLNRDERIYRWEDKEDVRLGG